MYSELRTVPAHAQIFMKRDPNKNCVNATTVDTAMLLHVCVLHICQGFCVRRYSTFHGSRSV